jgi:hypothetical protein
VSGTGDALIRQGKIGSSVETVVTLRMSGEKALSLRGSLAVAMGALRVESGERTAELRPAFSELQELRDALDTE